MYVIDDINNFYMLAVLSLIDWIETMVVSEVSNGPKIEYQSILTVDLDLKNYKF